MKRLMSTFGLLLGLFLFYSTVSFGALISTSVTKAIPVGSFSVGVGSSVVLSSDELNIAGESLFLGNIVKASGSPSYQMYLNTKSKKVFFIDSINFRKNSKLQTILDPHEQAGGTCAGYAIAQFMFQTHLSGFVGTGVLATKLSSEEGRTHLLADSINQYYLNLNRQFSFPGILNGFGKTFGFSCKKFKTAPYEQIKEKILAHLSIGSPVVVSFNIGPKMVNSPFKLKMIDQKNSDLDDRLWIPRKIGERNSGGHSIVAAASFEFNHKTYLVMLDSDWSEPRIWDMDSFISHKTDMDEIEFISCK